MAARTARIRGAGPQAQPIFQPVTLNDFPAEEIVTVRSAIPGSVAIGICCAASNVRYSYTSSVTTIRSCAMAISAMTASSAALSTVPVGLCGLLISSRRVRSVMACASRSASSAKRPAAERTSGTATDVAPDIATTAG